MIRRDIADPGKQPREGHDYRINVLPEREVTIKEYLEAQGRFKHVTPEMIDSVERRVNYDWDELLAEAEAG